MGEVDDHANIGIRRYRAKRGGRLFQPVAEGDENGAKLLIGQRFGIGIVGNRQPHQRQHEGLRAVEAVAVQAAGQDFQRGEELARAGGIGRCGIA